MLIVLVCQTDAFLCHVHLASTCSLDKSIVVELSVFASCSSTWHTHTQAQIIRPTCYMYRTWTCCFVLFARIGSVVLLRLDFV
jgi:hypothetical protein